MAQTQRFPRILFGMTLLLGSLPSFAQTWTSLTSGSTANLGSVHFPTAQVGYATGLNNVAANILKTTNGGASWAPTTNMNWTYLGLHFLNADTGWIVGNGGDIRKTVNGGTSWINQTPVGGTDHLNAVQFVNPLVGWVALNSGGSVRKTTDGGTTWTTQSLGQSMNVYGLWFHDTLTGFTAGSQGIRKTVNGGTSWTSVSSTNLTTITFPTRAVGYAAGGLAVILKSTDSGNTWSSKFGGVFSSFNANSFHSLSCVDADRCYAAASTTGGVWRIFATLDGGASWAVVDSGSGAGFTGKVGIHFPNASAGYFVAQGGQIRKSGAVPASLTSYEKSKTSAAPRLLRNAAIWRFDFTLEKAERYEATLTDLNGRVVWATSGRSAAGPLALNIPAQVTGRGVHVLSFRAGSTRHALRLAATD